MAAPGVTAAAPRLPAAGALAATTPDAALVSYESALQQWRAGERRLAAAPPERRRVLERVIERIYNELRRRLGGTFTVAELVTLYDAGTGWSLDIAVAAAPDSPWAWEASTVADAAFARYLREAADYAGGRLSDASS